MDLQRPEKKEEVRDGDEFVVLDRRHENEAEVIDVYLGQEKKLVKLPRTLARGLRSLLVKTPTKRTVSRSDKEDIWDSVLTGFWMAIGETLEEPGDGFTYTHVTESLQLPEIGIEMFNAFKDWAIQKKRELEKKVQKNTIPGDKGGAETRVKISKKDLREELWTLMGEYAYLANVRAESDGEAEEVSDHDEYVGTEHGGELRGAFLPYPGDPREQISKGWMEVYENVYWKSQ